MEHIMYTGCRYVLLPCQNTTGNGEWKGRVNKLKLPISKWLTWSTTDIFSFTFLDTHNYNYLKQSSHWEHANFRSMHLKNSEWFIGSLSSFGMLQGEIHCSGLVDTGTFLILLSKEQLRE